MIEVKETWVSVEGKKRYQIGTSGWYESFAEETGELFRACQREYGRCISRMYVDVAVAFHKAKAKAIGWVFEKRKQYSDCDKTYIQETWIQYKR